jgi:hypothetical protein
MIKTDIYILDDDLAGAFLVGCQDLGYCPVDPRADLEAALDDVDLTSDLVSWNQAIYDRLKAQSDSMHAPNILMWSSQAWIIRKVFLWADGQIDSRFKSDQFKRIIEMFEVWANQLDHLTRYGYEQSYG